MYLNDPNRPQINGRAAYGSPPLAVFPAPQVWPLSPDECEISMMLAVRTMPLAFSQFTFTIKTYHLEPWFIKYYTDPEQALFDAFNWTVPAQRSYHGFVKGVTPNPLADLEID